MSTDPEKPAPIGFDSISPPEAGTHAKPTKLSAKVMLGSLDEPSVTVVAQFNPKELEVAQNVPWTKTNEANKAKSQKDSKGGIHMEFTGAEGRSLSLELLFDAYETGDSSYVTKNILALKQMASVRKAEAKTESEKRPHHCVMVWGNIFGGSSRFQCVIQSLNVKYTMFDAAGQPLRATAVVKLAEADVVSVQKKKR